ncbi:MAG: hypothetical protein SFW36_08640 [Leptolyngbyaceae cyanobacterium bins.59]|nr:hypothetical protein [Leptolyngbyaceae cyanobacterium bins.59]
MMQTTGRAKQNGMDSAIHAVFVCVVCHPWATFRPGANYFTLVSGEVSVKPA